MAITKRLRTDLTEFAVARELAPGAMPAADSFRQVGLITGGVTLPDPNYEWEPYYGVGVSDRNFLFPVQGRHQFQGSIPSIYLTHAESRFLLEMLMGVAYRNEATGGGSVTNYDSTPSSSTYQELTSGITASTVSAEGSVAKHIVIASNSNKASWAYLGKSGSDFFPYRTRNLITGTRGWFGKAPSSVSAGIIRNIEDANINYGVPPTSKKLAIRQSIVQPTFSIGAKFFTDFGDRFNRVYTGFKINRATINLEEGRPVTMNVDFQGTGLVHDLGGAASATVSAVPRYGDGTVTGVLIAAGGSGYTSPPAVTFSAAPSGGTTATGTAVIANGAVTGVTITNRGSGYTTPPTISFAGSGGASAVVNINAVTPNFTFAPISSQPYFFSTAEVKFLGTPFARFRSLSIEINNQPEALFYVHAGAGASETDARQSPIEILEGRRAITLRGTLDGDGTAIGGTSNATFFEQLLQQGRSRTIAHNNLIGLSLEITLAVKNTEGGSTSNRIKIIIPGTLDTDNSNIQGLANTVTNTTYRTDTGLILRAAPHPISAPPAIAVPVEMEGMAASLRFELDDLQ